MPCKPSPGYQSDSRIVGNPDHRLVNMTIDEPACAGPSRGRVTLVYDTTDSESGSIKRHEYRTEWTQHDGEGFFELNVTVPTGSPYSTFRFVDFVDAGCDCV